MRIRLSLLQLSECFCDTETACGSAGAAPGGLLQVALLLGVVHLPREAGALGGGVAAAALPFLLHHALHILRRELVPASRHMAFGSCC